MGSREEQKVAIVTGAAVSKLQGLRPNIVLKTSQSGMGVALASHFVGKGWLVALFDVNDQGGQEIGD